MVRTYSTPVSFELSLRLLCCAFSNNETRTHVLTTVSVLAPIAHRAQQYRRQDHIDACSLLSSVNPVCNDLAAFDWQMELQCPL
jgi:hypothetical protein